MMDNNNTYYQRNRERMLKQAKSSYHYERSNKSTKNIMETTNKDCNNKLETNMKISNNKKDTKENMEGAEINVCLKKINKNREYKKKYCNVKHNFIIIICIV